MIRISIVLLAVCLSISACTFGGVDEPWTPLPAPTDDASMALPRFLIHYGEIVDTGRAGSSCWPIGQGLHRCGDGWGEFVTAFPMVVRSGGELRLETIAHEEPGVLRGELYDLAQESPLRKSTSVLSPDLSRPFNVDLPPGAYVLTIYAAWPIGDVGYQFKIEVVDTATKMP